MLPRRQDMKKLAKLVFGTTNLAKIAQVEGILMPAGIQVEGLGSLKLAVLETGNTARDNARIKALAYAKAVNAVVLSMDNALYLQGLSRYQQPGLHVRRINGGEAQGDEELISHYSRLIAQHSNGTMAGYWEYGLALAWPNGTSFEQVIVSPRSFVAVPTSCRKLGYPLESIQIDPRTGHYIAAMSEQEQQAFWQREIGVPLLQFVSQHIG